MKKFIILIHSCGVAEIDVEAEDLETAKEEALYKFTRTPLKDLAVDWEVRPIVCDAEEEEMED